MTIKITELNLFNNKGEVLGELGLSFAQGKVNGYTAHDFTKLSLKTKAEFNKVLQLIEDELNGVEQTTVNTQESNEVDKLSKALVDAEKIIGAIFDIPDIKFKTAKDFSLSNPENHTK